MSDIKVFRVQNESVKELEEHSFEIEKSLQTLVERNLETFLGVRFLASEYSTGKTHGGRIDTLGIDENGCPVIIEYKKSLNENVINQGLYYLDWLTTYRDSFYLLVLKRLGQKAAEEVDWSSPRLICIAGDFTKYDQYAVQQINRNIELVRYRKYGDDLVLLELVNATFTQTAGDEDKSGPRGEYKSVVTHLEQASQQLKDLFEALKAFLAALGDDVQVKTLKNYFAFRRFKNFACVEVHPQAGKLIVFVKVDPATVFLEKGFTRDVTNIGHYGTGNLEITIASEQDLERAKPLLVKSYEVS